MKWGKKSTQMFALLPPGKNYRSLRTKSMYISHIAQYTRLLYAIVALYL